MAGVIVGGRAVGARAGFDRRTCRDLLVNLLTGWLNYDGRYVAGSRVQTIHPGRILISRSVDNLARPGLST